MYGPRPTSNCYVSLRVTQVKDWTSMKSVAPSGASFSSTLRLLSRTRSYVSHFTAVE